MDISRIDANFRIKTKKYDDNIIFADVRSRPFSVHGLIYEKDRFLRIPHKVAKTVNEGVEFLNNNTAGGRVRFNTDASEVSVHIEYNEIGRMPHFPLTGSAGADIYADGIYKGTFIPGYDEKKALDGTVYIGDGGMKTVNINLPTYSGVSVMLVGLRSGSTVLPAPEYKISVPVLFYGSSITQGGCCSRPGCTYQQILSERLGFDYINLGFSGSARAEREIAEYISDLPMSVFIYDYDHNAPDAEHLKNTHERMFLTFREKNPDVPVIMMTRPKKHLDSDETLRLETVRATYESALASGDKNVYFIPGNSLIKDEYAEFALVDNCHPNDIGFMNMADAVEPVLAKVLGEIK